MTDRPPLLPTYSEYKPSRVRWLGEIPSHWNDLPLKRIATFRSGAGFPIAEQGQQDLELPFYKVSDMNLPGNEKTMKTENNSVSRSTAAKLKAYIFPQGTIIFPKVGGAMLTNKRRILEHPSCIDNNLMGCIVTHADPNFVFFLLQNTDFALIAKPGPLPAINARDVKNIRVPYPPIDEQAAIARYLTHKDNLIQRFLQGKRRMLDLLKQLRKSTIHYTVIHGLDWENTPKKPSGIPWIDEIPAHWEMRPLKFSATNVSKMTDQRNEDDLTLALENVESWSGKYTDAGPDVHFDSKLKQFQARDVLFGKLRPYLAKVVLPDRSGLCVGEFLVLRAREDILLPEYLWMLLRSPVVIDVISASSFGVKMPRTDWRFVGRMRLPVPPLEEQAAIAEYLIDRIAKIDAAIAGTSRLIDLMEQYRKSLIHELVTGARDVRKAAAAIPDDPAPDSSASTPAPSTP